MTVFPAVCVGTLFSVVCFIGLCVVPRIVWARSTWASERLSVSVGLFLVRTLLVIMSKDGMEDLEEYAGLQEEDVPRHG